MENDDQPVSATAGKAPPARPLDGVRVLLLDDDTDALEMLAVVLRLEGADVLPCVSSPIALERLNEWEADLIVSDIGMPELDGYEFIRLVRAGEGSSRLVPAIALSAYAAAEDATAARQAGFHQHMAKPLEPRMLVELARKLTGR